MTLPIGKVVKFKNEYDDGRIKVRIVPEDNHLTDENLPFAFPLLPKLFQSIPKEDESVFILSDAGDDNRGRRYYIGPIISQPQYFNNDSIENASAALRGGMSPTAQAPSTSPQSIGAYPTTEDVAIIGRRNSEIILRETDDKNSSEIDIRSGVRLDNDGKPAVFNQEDPACIQVRYTPSGIGTETDNKNGNSVINLVANKINLVGTTPNPQTNTPNISNIITKPTAPDANEPLIAEEKMQEILDKCHELPYGDILVEFLELFRKAFLYHTHSWPTNYPCNDTNVKQLLGYNINGILSQNVRIN